MPNTQGVKYDYDDISGCTNPNITSNEYQSWLWNLPPFLRDIMLEDLQERAYVEKEKSQCHGD
jgi:hypothetical protein